MFLVPRKVVLVSALLVLFSTITWTTANSEDTEDEATVEVADDDDQYKSPVVDPKKVYLAEHFDNVYAFNKKWVPSEAMKQGVDEDIAKYNGKWEIQPPTKKILKNDLGLVLTTAAKHGAISTLLYKPFEFEDKPLVVQYEVTMQQGQECGGGYLKLLSKGVSTKADLRKFHDQTPYTIMFGPDKCGNDNKLHFIFRHKNPKTGAIEEKHSKKPEERLDEIYKDHQPHLYTLIVHPDNRFQVLVDNKEVNSGSLLEDFTPPVNPPELIDDPLDRKPEDWDDREKIPDPEAVKPEDWDEDAPAQMVDVNAVKPDGWLDNESDMIPDPNAKKPEDWDDEMDGEWEAPQIDNPLCQAAPGCGVWKQPLVPNPDYKGIWRAPLIPNPNYKGKWAPRQIKNPSYFKDENPFKMTPIHAVGFELWSISPMLLFDNLIITDDPEIARDWARQTFEMKRVKLLSDADSVVERAFAYAHEHAWVYPVVVLVSVTLFGIMVYFCCLKTDTEPEFIHKKTDAFTEDDPHEEEGEEGKEEDVKEEEGQGEEVEDSPPEKAERPKKADLEGPVAVEPDSTEATPLLDNDGAGDGQRKRKPRKE